MNPSEISRTFRTSSVPSILELDEPVAILELHELVATPVIGRGCSGEELRGGGERSEGWRLDPVVHGLFPELSVRVLFLSDSLFVTRFHNYHDVVSGAK